MSNRIRPDLVKKFALLFCHNADKDNLEDDDYENLDLIYLVDVLFLSGKNIYASLVTRQMTAEFTILEINRYFIVQVL